jgi:hypothetical protein
MVEGKLTKKQCTPTEGFKISLMWKEIGEENGIMLKKVLSDKNLDC